MNYAELSVIRKIRELTGNHISLDEACVIINNAIVKNITVLDAYKEWIKD